MNIECTNCGSKNLTRTIDGLVFVCTDCGTNRDTRSVITGKTMEDPTKGKALEENAEDKD